MMTEAPDSFLRYFLSCKIRVGCHASHATDRFLIRSYYFNVAFGV